MEKHLTIHLPASALEPLIAHLAQAVQERLGAARSNPSEQMALTEPEAAALLGLKPHQLRDARRAGRVRACQITGRRIRYRRVDLLRYLEENLN
ncbi:MAG: helix-turn-helix domain-containing protein [Planctomycetia bacterium]|nr:helix-turn-helix domain-containing protein [Planctomycetia bacterium]